MQGLTRTYLLALLLCLSLTGLTQAQEGVGNHGSLRLHADGAAGIHGDFINQGAFENQSGLVGFYREGAALSISGTHTPVIYDAEFDVPAGIWLETPLAISNNANLVSGDIRTTRVEAVAYTLFSFDSFYTGDSDVSKVDGYAGMQNKREFTFPIGDISRLRELTITADTQVPMARAAYFYEAPQASGTLGRSFKSEAPEGPLKVSQVEFWKLEGPSPVRATLTWDVLSNVSGLSSFLEELRVVGWSKSAQAWVDLGNTDVRGGRDYGSITSGTFIPDQYEIITLGGTDLQSQGYRTVELDNYYLSPNGDGLNETLELEAAADSPNNSIQIYNRYGQLVFQQDQYTGGFDGNANVDLVVSPKSGLEDGIYFYIITFHDLRERHQGYFYLNR
ncbi:gliding motility-associated C-terminal domain-containing protein [Robiginitalea sediminis]|uniref:gliding motility-associated C-terminal domain-containing protein n=1 Tax=Robiginitalea sediminis TaxID=1982593 RepID=UPI000B4BF456|nr:gliding motility-associated C-terminal domain-containing protein [Robiginitalea sediminis]